MNILYSVTNKDHEEIMEIHNLSFDNKWNIQSIETMCEIENYSFIIIKTNNEILGYIILYDTLDSFDLFEIAVKNDHRNQGLGTKLLKALFVRYTDKDIFLEVNEINVKALSLYEKNGFVRISLRKNYYKDNKNAIIMVKKYDV